MTAAAQIGREVDAAAEAMIAEHKAWYEEAIATIERRLTELEAREQKVAEAERWIREKRVTIEQAIGEVRAAANA
jgi:hypothetical protein